MKQRVMVDFINHTKYSDGSRLDRTDRVERWQAAEWLKNIRANLSVVILRTGPHSYFVTTVAQVGTFDRTIEIKA